MKYPLNNMLKIFFIDVGDSIAVDEVVCEIETDKVNK